eukprot:g5929.t1
MEDIGMDRKTAAEDAVGQFQAQGPRTMPQTDREALVALFNATDGRNWNDNTNWGSDAPLSGWHGVTATQENRVVELRLQDNNLRGTIPPQQLGDLRQLQRLWLNQNHLTGRIPEELGKLTALRQIVLYDNQLSGAIPRELGDLRELRRLSLSTNQLTGHIPPQLGQLGALKSLSLTNNKLDGRVPSELGKLGALEYLSLANNELSGPVPSELGKLGALEYLYLESNQLSGPRTMPQTDREALIALFNATDGRNWNDNTNWGSDAPLSDWYGVTATQEGRVVDLDLQGNNLRGAIPPELGNLAALQTLKLGWNRLSGNIPPQLGQLGALETLSLYNNKFDGSIPPELGKLASLQSLGLSFNQLTGTIPPQVGDLQQLQSLWLNKNHLKGNVPPQLGQLGDLKELDLAGNNLGPAPDAYFDAVRSGLCNAYLAASVVGSGLVSTSEVGVMGNAGTALKLISGAVPVVGGLAGFADEALKAGDRAVQTRRVVKITALAPDAVECCQLAKRLALRLADGLTDGTIVASYRDKEHLSHNAAGARWEAGMGGWKQGIDTLDDSTEETFLNWFVDKVAECEADSDSRKRTSEQKAGRRLGKRHLRTLLSAVGRGCLEGARTSEEKGDRLFKVVAPDADARPAAPTTAPKASLVRAPAHGGSVDAGAEFAAMKAQMEALKAENKALTRRLQPWKNASPNLPGGRVTWWMPEEDRFICRGARRRPRRNAGRKLQNQGRWRTTTR